MERRTHMTKKKGSIPADNREVIRSADIPNQVFEDSLNMLYAAFTSAAQKYGPLHHQQMIQPHFVGRQDSCDDGEWSSSRGWAEFATVNSPANNSGWQQWHGPVEGLTYEWFGRFFGDPNGLDEFCSLAESFYLVLRKLNPELPETQGFELLLDLMHQAAASWPTTLLRSKESEWNLDPTEAAILVSDEATEAECDAIWNKAEVGPNGVPYFVHPTVETIQGNLFLAAAQFAKMVARDDLTLFLSDMHLVEPDYPILEDDGAGDEDSSILPKPHVPITKHAMKPLGQSYAKTAEAVPDFVFAFDAVRRQWHVRFRYGETAEEVEEDWLQDSPSIRYIPYLLERPKDQVLCTTIFPPLPAETVSRSADADVRVEFADDHQTDHKSAAQKASKQSRDEWKQRMTEVSLEIKEARESGDEQNAVALEETFALLEQQYNREFDIHGRVRTGVSSADQIAANRIRNGIGRLLEKCIDGSKEKKYALNRFAEHLEKRIHYNSGHAYYDDSTHWHVAYPPDVR